MRASNGYTVADARRETACPTCYAEEGQPCITASGRTAGSEHTRRLIPAARIYWSAWDEGYNAAEQDAR